MNTICNFGNENTTISPLLSFFNSTNTIPFSSYSSSKKQNVIIISIEGNIGSGKSTLISKLRKKYPFIEVTEECINQWTNVNGVDVLNAFYEDKLKYSYAFQSLTMVTRGKQIRNLLENSKTNNFPIKLIVLERSPFSDRIFANNLKNSGFIDEVEWQIYLQWHEQLSNLFCPYHFAFIYLDVDYKTCYRRICNRQRSQELNIPIQYIKDLQKEHRIFFEKKDNYIKFNNDGELTEEIFYNFCEKFENFIMKTISDVENFKTFFQENSNNNTNVIY